jgi:hypothetical protein
MEKHQNTMKKILLIPFLLSFHFAYAGTGGARDEIQFLLVILAVLLLIYAVLYLIDFVSKIIKQHKEKKITYTADETDSGPISE